MHFQAILKLAHFVSSIVFDLASSELTELTPSYYLLLEL